MRVETFKDIITAIVDRARLDPNDNKVITQLKEKINTKYQEICFEEFYWWSGDTRTFQFKPRYSTGTVSVTKGSDTVTGTGTGWTEISHLGAKIKLGSYNYPFKIIRVDEGTQTIILDAAYPNDTLSGSDYLIFRDTYGLWPDYQNIRKMKLIGTNNRRQPQPASLEEYTIRRSRSPFRSGPPKIFTEWGNDFYNEKTWATFNINTDYWEQPFTEVPDQKAFMIWPAVHVNQINAQMRITIIPSNLGNDNDKPIIPVNNRIVLVYGVLVEHFLQNKDIQLKREWNGEYNRYKTKLAADIETTDDELVLHVDKRGYSRRPRFAEINEDIFRAD